MGTYAKILEGLQIFAKYTEPSLSVAHDEIHAGAASEVDEYDAARLQALGWMRQEPTWWRHFT